MERTYIDRIILYLTGVTLIISGAGSYGDVAYILAGFIAAGILCCIDADKRPWVKKIIYFGFVFLCIPVGELVSFLPLMLYSVIFDFRKQKLFFVCCTVAAAAVELPYILYDSGSAALFPVMLAALALACSSSVNYEQEHIIKKMRDDSAEYSNMMMNRNKYLEAAMENEVRVATLSERNRIAREIHDNAGHLVTRSILQLGAVMTVNRESGVYDMLVPVKDSLDTAMNSIRESVHDLHKDSFDMKPAAEAITGELKDFNVDFVCDISENADSEIKYALLTILKEAVTNIIKHSNGDSVKVVINELEQYYQMLVEDNGRNDGAGNDDGGIGLVNMELRVKKLGGIINISGGNGFRIYISIPKKAGNRE